MSLPVVENASALQFPAVVLDEKGEVGSAFKYRIVHRVDNLIIKLLEQRPEWETYGVFRKASRNDMDSDERWQVTLLNSLNISSFGRAITMEPQRYSWFARAGQVSVKGADGEGQPVGTLMLLNDQNVKLLNDAGKPHRRSLSFPSAPEAERLDELIHQLLEMVSTTARQHHIYGWGIKGLPRLADAGIASSVTGPWPLLESLAESYIEQCLSKGAVLGDVIHGLSQVVDTLANLHERGVAHGDIRLEGLREFSGWLGPGLPERFSRVDVAPGPDTLGRKRFIFYNNAWQPPELRFPGVFANPEQPFAPWQYTSATREGDIWSFGVMLAVIVYATVGEGEWFKADEGLQLSLFDYMKTTELYDCTKLEQAVDRTTGFLANNKSLLALNMPSVPISISLTEDDRNMLAPLIRLIGQCTRADPQTRPTAENVKEQLSQLV
ncbi:hypothetical protein [Endozoicomonas sp. GU-1]|uniref:hypothetical protein n=1 Tax=Endozoicomonas sp. GU-1 TaxID=3009078 RepID=UPI0022B2D253|nr:hypothetical protein [Endozoicomonas sp. GU-1]WBA79903.1 hypothetical protein O2T12_16230 [Endozoicomonas sp. GU-1]WBA87478.1 hypothetical protein O3276_05465 [Endozoicomonas sp. GU-1]